MYKKILQISVLFIVSGGGTAFASTLDIYQDGAKYRMIPADSYLGFTKGIVAVCEGQTLSLKSAEECAENNRLCKAKKDITKLEIERNILRYESETLEKLITLSKPTQIDASKWIEAASKIGKHKAVLLAKEKHLSVQLQDKQAAFSRQAPSNKPLFLQKKCAGELELTIPAGYIGARLLYEADTSNPASISVKQYIALSNRSGIDIIAKEGHIYAKSYRVYLHPQQFQPWIARIQQERRAVKKSRALSKMSYAEAPMESAGADMAAVEPVANVGSLVQMGYKNYQLSGIELPSTGEEIKIKLAEYTVPATCTLVSYPYRDTQVYQACRFTPKTAIESNRWRIEKNKRLVSDQAYGAYREGKYLLNVDVDDEVVIHRKPIVKRDRSSGIFGGSIRKKDGFVLDLTNLSNQTKKIRIIERIPTSTTDKIKVKLLQVEGADSHKPGKDGRVDIVVSLAPKAHKKVKVLFELSYDKNTKVRY